MVRLNQRYVLQRIVIMIISIFIILSMLFFLFRQVPGGPVSAMAPGSLPADVRARLIEQYGLNRPLSEQYIAYMVNFVQGDFGRSFYFGRPVRGVVADRLVNTVALMLPAILLSYTLGTYLGAHLGWIRGSRMERFEMVIVLLLRSTPVFWTGMVLLYIFGFELAWLPLGGMTSVSRDYSGLMDKFLSVDFAKHVILPVVSLSFYYTGLPLLLMRNNMLETLTEEYIQTARAKGLSDRRIMLRHAARNALLPVITAFAVAIGFTVGGQVLIETVFSWPGLGQEMVKSALRSDYPVAQATFLLLATMVILMNFIADLLYTYLDPRVRLGASGGE